MSLTVPQLKLLERVISEQGIQYNSEKKGFEANEHTVRALLLKGFLVIEEHRLVCSEKIKKVFPSLFDSRRSEVEEFRGQLTFKMKRTLVAVHRRQVSSTKGQGLSGAHWKTLRALWMHGLVRSLDTADGTRYTLTIKGMNALLACGWEREIL